MNIHNEIIEIQKFLGKKIVYFEDYHKKKLILFSNSRPYKFFKSICLETGVPHLASGIYNSA